MSYKRSVFPEGGYDTFIELYDLPPSYEPLVSEFAQLRANQNKTSEEEARFNELTTMLQNYILTAEKWNKFCDAVTGLQKFFLENTQGYIDGLKTETRQTVDSGKAEINTTKDNALITIENKKDNIIAYMDETTAGAIRNDIGVMGDSTVEGRSLVDKTNLLKTQVDTNVQNITDNSNKINNLSTEVIEHKAEKVQHLSYATASGTNTYTTAINGISSLVEGMSVKIKFTNANTGASTLNINSLGAKPIQKSNGNDLSSGNIKAGQICHLVYTGSVFQLLGEGGEYGTAQAQDVISGKTIGTEEGIKTGTMPNNGAINRTITTQGGQIYIPKGYHNGSGYVKAQFANLVADNIKKGVNIGGVVGNLLFYEIRQIRSNDGLQIVAYGLPATPVTVFFKTPTQNQHPSWFAHKYSGFIYNPKYTYSIGKDSVINSVYNEWGDNYFKIGAPQLNTLYDVWILYE